MNAKPNLTSNATKVKSLVAALTIVIGLHGALLWQLDKLANSDAQIAMLAAGAPPTGTEQTSPTPTDRRLDEAAP